MYLGFVLGGEGEFNLIFQEGQVSQNKAQSKKVIIIINKNQKRQNLKNNHILIFTLGRGNESETFTSTFKLIFVIIHFSIMSTSPSCHTCQAHTFKLIFVIFHFSIMSHMLGSSTFKLIFVIIHFSIMSHVLGSHGNEPETFKNNHILILNQAHPLLHHITLGGAMSQNEMEIFQGFVMSHVLGSPNEKAKIRLKEVICFKLKEGDHEERKKN